MQLAWEQREAELELQLDQQEDENLSRAELVHYYYYYYFICKMGPVIVQFFVSRILMVQSPCQIPASLLLIS